MSEQTMSKPSKKVAEIISFLGLKIDEDGALLINPSRVKVYVKNPRKKFRNILGLARSIEGVGKQIQPGIVRLLQGNPDFDAELVDGERRIRALRLLHDRDKKWMFRAFPNTTINDDKTHFRESFIANFCKEEHDCIEIANGIKELMDGGETMASVAEMAGGKSLTWVSQHLSLLKLDPEVQAMIVPDEREDGKKRLSFAVALRLASYPRNEQVKAARQIEREGMSQVKARRFIMQVGRKLGTKAISSRRRPDRALESLMKFTENIGEHIGIYLDMPESEIDTMLATASEPTKNLLLRRLRFMEEGIARLSKSVMKRSKGLV